MGVFSSLVPGTVVFHAAGAHREPHGHCSLLNDRTVSCLKGVSLFDLAKGSKRYLRVSLFTLINSSISFSADFGSAALSAPANSFVGTPYW